MNGTALAIVLSKPDPEPYRLAMERSGCRPEECLVVEDSERGAGRRSQAETAATVIDSLEGLLDIKSLIRRRGREMTTCHLLIETFEKRAICHCEEAEGRRSNPITIR